MEREKQGWQWFGQAGHFCWAADCQFHLHTHVGGENGFCVSTVGEYYPMGKKRKKPTEVAIGRLYETMVFKLKDGGIDHYAELQVGKYNDRDAANAGHMAMCDKWDTKCVSS